MDDPKSAARRWLNERNEPDALRVLERCEIELRHVGTPSGEPEGSPPEADVFIAAPGDLITMAQIGSIPGTPWGQLIERALIETSGGAYGVRQIQWVETRAATTSRPGTAGMGPSGGDARA